MPVVKNEQEVKRESQFLKYIVGEDGNNLILKSHLYKIPFHFLSKPISRSVICKGEKCAYCEKGMDKRSEYNYMVFLNGETGFIDVKPSVFFAIQGISKAQKKDPRQISWTIIKTGSGLETNYTVSKDDNLSKEDYDKITAELDANTDKLSQLMIKHEEQLVKNYVEFLSRVGEVQKATPGDEPPPPDDPES